MNSKEGNSRFMTFVCAVAILVLFYKTILFVVIGLKAALWADQEEKFCPWQIHVKILSSKFRSS